MSQKITVSRHTDRQQELSEFLTQQFIGSLATAENGTANLATVFFVYSEGALFFKSRTHSRHSLHAHNNPHAAFTAYDHASHFADKYGVQLEGQVARITDETEMAAAIALFNKRFPEYAEKYAAKLPPLSELCSPAVTSTYYRFSIARFKIVDENPDANRTMPDYEIFQSGQKEK